MADIPGYDLKRPLGRGGMAVVYLAIQESLGREVALKVLAPSQDDMAGERFLREARIAASLHHPHIVPIYDFGVHQGQAWLAMQYLPLGTVQPRAGEHCDPATALRIVRDIASALAYAHGHGVVHRDVKPDNILRGESGVMLSDFGIARLIHGESALTRDGTSVGTPHYMSPEQLRGDKLDGRSDLYSLGVVLYQLLTGELPFVGADGWAIGNQHLNSTARRLPAASAALQPLVDCLMAKSPDDRPRGGEELVRWVDDLLALESAPRSTPTPQPAAVTAELPPAPQPRRRTPWVAAGAVLAAVLAVGGWLAWTQWGSAAPASVAPVPESPSLAVLPFDDLSPEHDQSYFSEGMAEEVSNRLAQVNGLRVAGRTSAQSFRGKHASVAEVGRALNVNRVLAGSVQRDGEKLRVTVQLTNVADGFQLWSQSFDRQVTDVFAVQDEIAGAVVDTLKLKLLKAPKRHVPSVEVYDLYLRGLQLMIRGQRETLRQSRDLLRKAVALDPKYAPPHSVLAMAEVFAAPPDPQSRAAAMKLGMAAAERAIELDPTLGDAYASRGFLRRIQWDWDGALADSRKSVALDGGDARNHLRYAGILAVIGELEQARVEAERAIEIDPLLTPAWNLLVQVKFGLLDVAGARRALERTEALEPGFSEDPTLPGDMLLLEGHAREARDAYLATGEAGTLSVIVANYSLGEVSKARTELARFEREHPGMDPFTLASAHAWMDEPDRAFALLEQARLEHSPGILFLAQSPFLRKLHKDPRYRELQVKLGLPPHPPLPQI